MFLSRNKKNNVYPCKPQFYYIKVGFKGGQNYIGVFSWWIVALPVHLLHYSPLPFEYPLSSLWLFSLCTTHGLVGVRGRVCVWGGGGLLTFDMVQTCDWNFYYPDYSYILQIPKYIPINSYINLQKGTLFIYYCGDFISIPICSWC